MGEEGREKTVEDQAQAIINQSDESVDDLLDGTEVSLEDTEIEDEEPLDLVDELEGDY